MNRKPLKNNSGSMRLLMLLACCWMSGVSLADEPTTGFIRQVVEYQVPNLTVIRHDGVKSAFDKQINDGRPVVLSFIFASCSAICPMLSHTLMKVQDNLDKRNQKAHLVSVTIDPETDTPSILSEYAKKFAAGPNWDFYTCSRDVSIGLQKAFNVFRGDKMNHASVILIRLKPGAPWIRLEGFFNSETVLDELKV